MELKAKLNIDIHVRLQSLKPYKSITHRDLIELKEANIQHFLEGKLDELHSQVKTYLLLTDSDLVIE